MIAPRRMGPKPRDPMERMLAKVAIDPEAGCWLYMGGRSGHGYGGISQGVGRTLLVHRLAHERLIGPIPDGYHVDHLCRVRNCVNPDHLEAVTAEENWRRSDAPSSLHARQTHCQHGHEFTAENTYRNKHGWRSCRECLRTKWRVGRQAS